MWIWALLAVGIIVQADVVAAEWFVEGYGGYSVKKDLPLRRILTEGQMAGAGHGPEHDHDHDNDHDHDHDDDHDQHGEQHGRARDLSRDIDLVGRIVAGVRAGRWFDAAPWIGVAAEGIYQRATFQRQTAMERDIEIEHGHEIDVHAHEKTIGPGRASVYGGFANLMLRYPGTWLQPYGGAGIGALHASLSDGGFGGLSATNFAWQTFAGVKMKVTGNLGVFAEYKWIGATFSDSTASRAARADYRSGNAIAGISWHFQ